LFRFEASGLGRRREALRTTRPRAVSGGDERGETRGEERSEGWKGEERKGPSGGAGKGVSSQGPSVGVRLSVRWEDEDGGETGAGTGTRIGTGTGAGADKENLSGLRCDPSRDPSRDPRDQRGRELAVVPPPSPPPPDWEFAQQELIAKVRSDGYLAWQDQA
jgi:hypothetical protein